MNPSGSPLCAVQVIIVAGLMVFVAFRWANCIGWARHSVVISPTLQQDMGDMRLQGAEALFGGLEQHLCTEVPSICHLS
jgi:hypothetical protein